MHRGLPKPLKYGAPLPEQALSPHNALLRHAHAVSSGASIGVVSSASRLATVDDYLRAADTAMYRAKSQSLGVCVVQ